MRWVHDREHVLLIEGRDIHVFADFLDGRERPIAEHAMSDQPKCIAFVVVLAVLLIGVCWLTGEPPRWRWGDDDPGSTNTRYQSRHDSDDFGDNRRSR